MGKFKGVTSKSAPRKARTGGPGPLKRGGSSSKISHAATTATPGRSRSKPVRVSAGAQPGRLKLGKGPVTAGRSK